MEGGERLQELLMGRMMVGWSLFSSSGCLEVLLRMGRGECVMQMKVRNVRMFDRGLVGWCWKVGPPSSG